MNTNHYLSLEYEIEWRPVYGLPNRYEINIHGEIRCTNYKRLGITKILKQIINTRGYKYISISIDGKRINKTVHRLIALTFIPNPENKPVTNHIDGNKLNNSISNLEWVTHSENNAHAYKIGTKIPYSKNNI